MTDHELELYMHGLILINKYSLVYRHFSLVVFVFPFT